MSDRQAKRLVGLLALLAAAGTLAVLGGSAGVLFGAAAVAAWLVAPPVFAFVLAQSGLAAVASPPYPPLLVGAELGLLVLLAADPQLRPAIRSIGPGLLGVGALAAVTWLLQPIPLWLDAVVILLGTTGLAYGAHRYELLVTGQLTDQ